MKKLLAFAIFICSLSFSSVAHATCSTYPYKSNYYDGGSWVNFNDNTRAQQLISSRQAEDILSIDENGDGYLFTNDTYFSCSKPRLTVQSTGSRGLFIPGQYNHLGTQSTRDKFLDLANKLNSWMFSNPIVVPTTTTITIPPTTTTTTVPLNGCIKSISGQQIYHTVTWFYAQGTGPPNNPAYQSMSLALWQSMTHEQKINSGPLYMWPSPTGGCNQLYSYPPVITTTTIPPPTTTTTTSTTTTVPQTTTTVAPTTTTTTVPRTTTTIAAPVVQQQAPSKPIAPAAPVPAQLAKPQAPALAPVKPIAPATPVPAQPVQLQAPTATLPKIQPPAIPSKLQWTYVTKRVLQTIPSNIKTGAVCKNGSSANTVHPLTCLKQGGLKKWIYLPKKIYVNKKHICYLNKSTNKYTKNCKLA